MDHKNFKEIIIIIIIITTTHILSVISMPESIKGGKKRYFTGTLE